MSPRLMSYMLSACAFSFIHSRRELARLYRVGNAPRVDGKLEPVSPLAARGVAHAVKRRKCLTFGRARPIHAQAGSMCDGLGFRCQKRTE